MKISVRLLLLVIVVLASLGLNACSGVQAAQGSGLGLNALSSTDVVSTVSVSSNDILLGTATPDASGISGGTETPDVSVTETHAASETHTANELVGVITAMDATTVTIDGVVYNLATFSEVKGSLKVGDTVKLEFITNADGTLTVREIQISTATTNENGNENSNGSMNENGNSNSNENGSSNSNGNSNENVIEHHATNVPPQGSGTSVP